MSTANWQFHCQNTTFADKQEKLILRLSTNPIKGGYCVLKIQLTNADYFPFIVVCFCLPASHRLDKFDKTTSTRLIKLPQHSKTIGNKSVYNFHVYPEIADFRQQRIQGETCRPRATPEEWSDRQRNRSSSASGCEK